MKSMKYRIELISKEMIAEGTMAFQFKKPTGFQLTAGPQLIVYAMRNLLNSAGISNDDIKFEEFSRC